MGSQQSITSGNIPNDVNYSISYPNSNPSSLQTAGKGQVPSSRCARPSFQSQKSAAFPSGIHRVRDITDRFQNLQPLETGRDYAILKAQHIANGNIYRLKVFPNVHRESARRFAREAAILRNISHPNILHFSDCYVDNQGFYLVSQLCTGNTLNDRIGKIKSFTERKQYIHSILSALSTLHSFNTVVRNLTANTLRFDKVGAEGVLKINDVSHALIVRDDAIYTDYVPVTSPCSSYYV